MGYRLHLYQLDDKQIQEIVKGSTRIYTLKDSLCVERNAAFSNIFTELEPLFEKGSEAYTEFEETEYCPRKVSKENLKKLVGCFYKLYQDYLGEFMESLEDKEYLLRSTHTVYDILLELVYLYKTFNESKTLVLAGW